MIADRAISVSPLDMASSDRVQAAATVLVISSSARLRGLMQRRLCDKVATMESRVEALRVLHGRTRRGLVVVDARQTAPGDITADDFLELLRHVADDRMRVIVMGRVQEHYLRAPIETVSTVDDLHHLVRA